MADLPTGTIGEVVRGMRQAKHWSIRRLAHEAHVGRQAISAIERNTSNWKRSSLEAIAHALGTSASDIDTLAARKPPPPLFDLVSPVLPPEWILFAQRAAKLSRLAQATLQMSLLAFEEAEAYQQPKTTPAEPPAPLTAFRQHA